MENNSLPETIRMYAPVEPCKHHVSSSKVHPYFNEHKESFVSKKITIMIKLCATLAIGYLYIAYVMPTFTITTDSERIASYIMPVFLIGFALYEVVHLFYKVELFETGLVYHKVFSHKEYAYDDLYDIQMRYDENFNLDQRRHGFLWFIFAKRFYRYYSFTFTNAKGFRLQPRVFRNLDTKIIDLQKNLIDVKVKGE